jgi:Mpp10 protein
VSALQLEEATPDTISEGQQLAPEEVYRKTRAAPRSESEHTKEEREARRRTKKRVKRKREQERKQERKAVDRTSYGNKYNKERTLKELRSAKNVSFVDGKEHDRQKVNYNKSSTVFKMLQESKDPQPSASTSGSGEQSRRFKL